MRISLHKILEETLGIGKINNKEDLLKLLDDKERIAEAVKAIKEVGENNAL